MGGGARDSSSTTKDGVPSRGCRVAPMTLDGTRSGRAADFFLFCQRPLLVEPGRRRGASRVTPAGAPPDARETAPNKTMSKRAAPSSAGTPAPKQPRVGDATPVTAARPHGRVVLDVGGTRFVSSRTTLERASTYFASLLARWDEDTDEPLFIDSDADAFQVLLSYMRLGALTLPQHDEALCARVLLQAEYLGMESLLDEVKAVAYANMHGNEARQEDVRPAATAFDEDVGTLQDAIRAKVLPARFFAPAPAAPPEPPTRTVKAIMPAPAGYRVMFTNGVFDFGEARRDDEDTHEDRAPYETMHAVSFALVEHRATATKPAREVVDVVVQRNLASTRHENGMYSVDANTDTKSHIRFASEVGWAHWLLLPPQVPGRLHPIPPGTVRGQWRKPALTNADVGKSITVTGNTIRVGDEVRRVVWTKDPPANITNETLNFVHGWNSVSPGFTITVFGQLPRFELPYIHGKEEIFDLAFATVDGSEDAKEDEKMTRYYIPTIVDEADRGYGRLEGCITQMAEVSQVTFGDLCFYDFVGTNLRSQRI